MSLVLFATRITREQHKFLRMTAIERNVTLQQLVGIIVDNYRQQDSRPGSAGNPADTDTLPLNLEDVSHV